MTDQGQRGVIVAPPSGNTSPSPHEPIVLHKGFDTLALAIKAHITPDFFDYLEDEKARADEERRDILIDYEGLQMHLKPHGGNGYRFILSGGPDGATWFFKKPNASDEWGIRLSFGSYFLAMHGLGAAKAHSEFVLGRLGVRLAASDVSISRADVCVDVLMPEFTLIPDQFVMHSSTGRRDYITAEDQSVHGKSGRVTSVTVGSTRNRQVIIYDKRSEVIAKSKTYWWEIWNHNLLKVNKSGVLEMTTKHHFASEKGDQNRPKTINSHETRDIYRCELRAGKDLLKDRWGIRTWEDLFSKFGDLCKETCEVVRYTEPNPHDPNRARWPNHVLWDIASAEINADLFEMRSGADPNPMKEVHREQHISTIFRNILGRSITLAALNDADFADLASAFSNTTEKMCDKIRSNPDKTKRQLQEAKERYVFIQTPSAPVL